MLFKKLLVIFKIEFYWEIKESFLKKRLNLKKVQKASQSCQKFIKKVVKSCQTVVKKLSKKLSKSCQKIVKINNFKNWV
jgi:hypothetical protein